LSCIICICILWKKIFLVFELELLFLSNIKTFMTELHMTYQSATSWCPSSIFYYAFFSHLFLLCLLRIQFISDHTRFCNKTSLNLPICYIVMSFIPILLCILLSFIFVVSLKDSIQKWSYSFLIRIGLYHTFFATLYIN